MVSGGEGTPLIPALRRMKQMVLCEFKASQPGLQSEFRTGSKSTEKPCLKIKVKQKATKDRFVIHFF